ncbi:MAG: hypothetical protein HY795_02245 [Desulfovibrio sp.]|nr:hypothetical protein [Desulfovibrio sp.]MBI4961156.1 hypothetical protein [Desulfovibrio sp.]
MHDGMISQLDDGTLYVRFNNELYELEAIRAAAFKFSGNYFVLMKPFDAHEVILILDPKPDCECNIENDLKCFCNETLDQQIRLDLEKRYGNMKELIVRQAFLPVEDGKMDIKCE